MTPQIKSSTQWMSPSRFTGSSDLVMNRSPRSPGRTWVTYTTAQRRVGAADGGVLRLPHGAARQWQGRGADRLVEVQRRVMAPLDHRLRICSLTFSTGVVVAAATPAPRWAIAALGGAGVLIEGSLQVTGYREQMLSVMDFRSRLEVELTLYRTYAAPYDDQETRFPQFVERVERIFRESDESQVSILQQPVSGSEIGIAADRI
ncbi:SLATT domain-containing protein [Streptomyces sp. NPDC046759]|uniref:SLATT domain-containing protein n=1 Tax=Streptomyces sp. NPDC046759 TaxID=3155019 RepID=UPI00340FD0C9